MDAHDVAWMGEEQLKLLAVTEENMQLLIAAILCLQGSIEDERFDDRD